MGLWWCSEHPVGRYLSIAQGNGTLKRQILAKEESKHLRCKEKNESVKAESKPSVRLSKIEYAKLNLDDGTNAVKNNFKHPDDGII